MALSIIYIALLGECDAGEKILVPSGELPDWILEMNPTLRTSSPSLSQYRKVAALPNPVRDPFRPTYERLSQPSPTTPNPTTTAKKDQGGPAEWSIQLARGFDELVAREGKRNSKELKRVEENRLEEKLADTRDRSPSPFQSSYWSSSSPPISRRRQKETRKKDLQRLRLAKKLEKEARRDRNGRARRRRLSGVEDDFGNWIKDNLVAIAIASSLSGVFFSATFLGRLLYRKRHPYKVKPTKTLVAYDPESDRYTHQEFISSLSQLMQNSPTRETSLPPSQRIPHLSASSVGLNSPLGSQWGVSGISQAHSPVRAPSLSYADCLASESQLYGAPFDSVLYEASPRFSSTSPARSMLMTTQPVTVGMGFVPMPIIRPSSNDLVYSDEDLECDHDII